MKKLYYSVEVELEDGSVTGNKTITGYIVENNELLNIFTIEIDLDEQSKTAIREQLELMNDETDYQLILI